MAQDLQDTSKTVAEKPDSADKPPEKDDSAPAEKGLDEILSEIDEEFERAKQPEQKPEQKASDDDADKTQRKLDAIEARLFNEDVNKAVGVVRNELSEELKVSDRAIRGYLSELYNEDERFKKAFDNRDVNPGAYSRALKAAAREARKDFGEPVDSQVTNDARALQAAVRGTKSANIAEDEAPDFGAWSDARFEHWKRTGKDNPDL